MSMGTGIQARKPLTRLVAVQGTMELLHVLSILYHGSLVPDNNSYDDYLLIYGIGLKNEHEKNILITIQEMAKCWNWHAIINAHGIENMSPGQEVYDLVGTDHADEVLVVRNWQKSNEILLSSYNHGKCIAYGDAFGFYDCHVGDGFIKIDQAHMMLPIEWVKNSLQSVPITVIPKQTVIDVIDKCIYQSHILTEYCMSITKLNNAEKVLVLLANISEIELMSFHDEVDTYVSLILESAYQEDEIFIKPHPREMNGQSVAIQEILKAKYGFSKVYILGNDILSKLPVEIYCRMLSFKKVITVLSTSAVSLHYLYDIVPVMGFSEFGYSKIVKNKSYYKEFMLCLNEIIYRKLPIWDGISIIYSFDITDPAYQAAIIVDEGYKKVADQVIQKILNHYPTKKVILFGANNISRYMLDNDIFANRVEFLIDSFKEGNINGKQVYSREKLKEVNNYVLIINIIKQAEQVMDTLQSDNVVSHLEIIRFDYELTQ